MKQRVATITIDLFLTPPRSALDLTGAEAGRPKATAFHLISVSSRDRVGGANQDLGKSVVWSEQLGNKRSRKESVKKLQTTLSQR